MNSRLFRSPTDRVLAGVAGGMAETYDIDPALVRIGWAVFILISGGLFLVIYIVMALVVPLRPTSMPLWASSASGAGAMPMPYSAMAGTGAADGPPPGPDGQQGPPPEGPFAPPDGAPLPQAAPYAPYPAHRDRTSNTTGAVVIGVILVAVGIFFLIRQYIPAFNLGAIWPVAVIIGGAFLIALSFRGRS